MLFKQFLRDGSETTPVVLVTGGTGYIGSQLIPALRGLPYRIRYTARNVEYKREQFAKYTEVMEANFTEGADMSETFKDVKVAFYLMHALSERKGFVAMEERVAKVFAKEAAKAGVERIIYLGGLVNPVNPELSAHMESRLRVGEILRESGIPVIEFRASVILGSGSISFEIVRALVERLPIMVTPKWVSMEAQPIYVEDVIAYLVQSVELPLEGDHIFEIGGKDRVSYLGLMEAYASERNLKRYFIRIPFLTPFLSSLWLSFVTPVYARVGRKLIESIATPSVVYNKIAKTHFLVDPIGVKAAIHKCLEREEEVLRQSHWVDTLSEHDIGDDKTALHYKNRIVDVHTITLPLFLPNPFGPIERIGGKTGWYHLNFLWEIRGAMDVMIGGVGLRRGRPDVHETKVGDTIDWWRVEAYEPGKRLRLIAEMKVPGRAWLEFELVEGDNSRKIVQTVVFDPLGLWGLIYWYALVPIHWILFKGMLKNIKKAIYAQADIR
tara:strand:- start:6442 stop:7929 length:1488 start_codon:yes stop_codon:yes gene_type:complete